MGWGGWAGKWEAGAGLSGLQCWTSAALLLLLGTGAGAAGWADGTGRPSGSLTSKPLRPAAEAAPAAAGQRSPGGEQCQAGRYAPGTRDHSRLPTTLRQLLPTAFFATTTAISRASCRHQQARSRGWVRHGTAGAGAGAAPQLLVAQVPGLAPSPHRA